MICKKCQTRNPNNSDHCIRCGAKFNKNSGFNYFIAFIAAASLCVVLAVILIIHLFSEDKRAVDTTTIVNTVEQENTVENSPQYVSAEYILELFNVEDMRGTITDEMQYIIEFGYGEDKYKLSFSENFGMVNYSVNEGKFTPYHFSDVVKIIQGIVTVPETDFKEFLNLLLTDSASLQSADDLQMSQ